MSDDFRQQVVFAAMKKIAKLFHITAECREYLRPYEQALKKSKKAKPSAKLKKNLMTLKRIDATLNDVYHNGYHDGAHAAAFSRIDRVN